ncbi:copper homeostasis CutC domain-containing protein [Penicillium cataractarum]|uniref:Copper homeostasis protein cutC homolog n=1 Tax=Penicillium cataractarum TaxID=2100454 RepID=A0A9W9S3S4_9EURO|nr:copper homeostasis CutC domain-containing protein [Penicillium cataractarum]KAJ5371527.1 copper homeostasis CutC domain-containing protein [Penicillium cataractarum]
MGPLLEIACFNEESAVNAANAGADRIELCQDYHAGGLSPHPAVLQAVKTRVSIPVYVMIRPHSKDFCYDSEDFETMKATLQLMNSLGADGFVFGILHQAPDHRSADRTSWIDIARNKELVQLADGKPCTFHRAFDCIPESDWNSVLEDIIECGFAAILTSGGPSSLNAVDCMDGLADLVNRLSLDSQAGRRALEVIVGGGRDCFYNPSSRSKTFSGVLNRRPIRKLAAGLTARQGGRHENPDAVIRTVTTVQVVHVGIGSWKTWI